MVLLVSYMLDSRVSQTIMAVIKRDHHLVGMAIVALKVVLASNLWPSHH